MAPESVIANVFAHLTVTIDHLYKNKNSLKLGQCCLPSVVCPYMYIYIYIYFIIIFYFILLVNHILKFWMALKWDKKVVQWLFKPSEGDGWNVFSLLASSNTIKQREEIYRAVFVYETQKRHHEDGIWALTEGFSCGCRSHYSHRGFHSGGAGCADRLSFCDLAHQTGSQVSDSSGNDPDETWFVLQCTTENHCCYLEGLLLFPWFINAKTKSFQLKRLKLS